MASLTDFDQALIAVIRTLLDDRCWYLVDLDQPTARLIGPGTMLFIDADLARAATGDHLLFRARLRYR